MKLPLLLIAFSIFCVSCEDNEHKVEKEFKIEVSEIERNGDGSSMRGLYMVDEKIAWCSGTNGVVMKTIDGENWTTYQNDAWLDFDFRDIHAFNENEAIIMSSGEGCSMFSTEDGGQAWVEVYRNEEEGIFFDGMDFWDDQNGIAYSDPIDSTYYLAVTNDGGKSWNRLVPELIPHTVEGEAGFAASGTGIVCKGDATVWLGTGGGTSTRVFKSTDRGLNWQVIETPMRKGEGNGIYAMSFLDENHGVVVGGNYLDSTNTEGNCAYTIDGGMTWELPEQSPQGYRSCVANNGDGVWVACGRTGVDYSLDNGLTWNHITDDAYYSCVLIGKTGWLTGRNGKMARLSIQD